MNQPSARKKILYVITKSNFGGAQKYVLELASHLPRQEFDVAVALGGTGKPGAPAGLLAQKLAESGIRTIFIPSLQRDINPVKELRVFWDLYRLFLREKPDVVHLNSSKAGGTGSLAARIAGIPKVVFTIHGWAFDEDRGAIARRAIRFASRLTARFSTDLIALSDKIAEQTEGLGEARGKIHRIHNGITPAYAKSDRGELHKELGLPAGKIVLGTIAELTKNKGLTYAISALAELKNPHVLLAIIGDGEERETLRKQAEAAGILDQVMFLGFKESAHRFISAFDIFFISSVKEGLPFVLLEAGVAGTPVIATNVGGIPELITHEKTGLLVEPKDPRALRLAWERLIGNPGAREILGKSLKTRVLESFSLAEMIEKTVRVYDPRYQPQVERSGVVILRNQFGNFLIQLRDPDARRLPGQWCLVGGLFEEGEEPLAAIAREVKEETNLTLAKQKILKQFSYQNVEVYIAYGEVDTGAEEMILGEGVELRFITPRDATDFITKLPYSNPFLEELLLFLKNERLN